MRAWARGALALAGAALVGCAPTVWSKPGATAEERDRALAACEAYADDYIDEDFPSRIEETQRGVQTADEESDLLTDFRRFDERTRRHSLIDSCMRQNGYTTDTPEDAGDDAGAPVDAS